MKVAVECHSPLLQKSLELFLVEYLSSTKQCDIVIRDIECINDSRCFYVSTDKKADLLKPFSKSQLILALEKRYRDMGLHVENHEVEVEEKISFDILEKRIEHLTQEYQRNIINSIKAFYES
jgi:hypothetical protein